MFHLTVVSHTNWAQLFMDTVFEFHISFISELKISLLSMTCDDPGIIDYKCWDARNSITINGKEYTRNNRGFNIAVIDFKSGEVEETISYDTYNDIQESRRLEEYIRKLPTNKIVCGVVKDEGHNRMTEGAKNAIVSVILSKYLKHRD